MGDIDTSCVAWDLLQEAPCETPRVVFHQIHRTVAHHHNAPLVQVWGKSTRTVSHGTSCKKSHAKPPVLISTKLTGPSRTITMHPWCKFRGSRYEQFRMGLLARSPMRSPPYRFPPNLHQGCIMMARDSPVSLVDVDTRCFAWDFLQIVPCETPRIDFPQICTRGAL